MQDDDTDTEDDLRAVSQKAKDLTPLRKNIFLQRNYWGLCTEATKKMKWDVMELERRCVNNTLFKSKDCNQAKQMLATLKEVENDHEK